MRLAGAAVRRIWTVELRTRAGGPAVVCVHCTALVSPPGAGSLRSAALAHLASHARVAAVPAYLRTCECRGQGCCWHPRHRGCAGPVLLALTRDRSGRTWRLADICAACATATENTAVVPDTLLGRAEPCLALPPPAARTRNGWAEERVRVRETLTYLAAALPRFTSPAARMLALQCTLRADSGGRVRLPAGLLRSMRLRGRAEVWEELAHGAWLRSPDLRSTPVEVQLLDTVVREQVPGGAARRRAAHWALHPTPLSLPTTVPFSLQLSTLVLASHWCDQVPASADLEVLARLSGHSPHQTAELLDRLVAMQALSIWRHDRDTGEAFWELPPPRASRQPASRHAHATGR